MRGRLIAATGFLLFSLPLMAAPADEEEDGNGGQLVFQIVKVLASTPDLDREARSALGSSLEFLFLQLRRSRTRSSAEALARTAVLRMDAGGGESRTQSILSKGPEMAQLLKKIVPDDYRRLCTAAMSAACMSESEATRYVADLIDALTQGRTVPD